jgi:hypothetical protein
MESAGILLPRGVHRQTSSGTAEGTDPALFIDQKHQAKRLRVVATEPDDVAQFASKTVGWHPA